jgi:ketosteroid isomerase-like protein
MADLTPLIETMEHRWMRAWAKRDAKALKAITASKFILLTASKPPMILDRPSWLEAVAKRYQCLSYRFADIYVRDLGKAALFTASMELEATLDGHDWSETVFVADVWRRGRMRRGWKLVQRSVSKLDDNPAAPKAIRSLQLWR